MANHSNTTEGGLSAFSRAAVPRRYRGLSVFAAGVAGFICGIVFWHLVGFWTLVNEAVFHRNPGDVAAPAPTRAAAAKSQGRQSGTSGPMPALNEACSDVLPGGDGVVQVSACGPHSIKFAPSRSIDRADFADFGSTPATTLINGSEALPSTGAPAVGGWAAEVAPVSKP